MEDEPREEACLAIGSNSWALSFLGVPSLRCPDMVFLLFFFYRRFGPEPLTHCTIQNRAGTE